MSNSPKSNVNNLESNFFDLEHQMENGVICRDLVCMNSTYEKGKSDHLNIMFDYVQINFIELQNFCLN